MRLLERWISFQAMAKNLRFVNCYKPMLTAGVLVLFLKDLFSWGRLGIERDTSAPLNDFVRYGFENFMNVGN